MRSVDLSGADLRWANLEGVDLTGSIIASANFEGANLKNASLKDTDPGKWWWKAKLEDAKMDGTILPDGTVFSQPTTEEPEPFIRQVVEPVEPGLGRITKKRIASTTKVWAILPVSRLNCRRASRSITLKCKI